MDMQHMSWGEIEAVLVSEGLGEKESRESSSRRMGEDGEYDLADFMDGGDSPEARAIIDELEAMGLEFLGDEYGIEDAADEPEPEAEAPAPWAWLKRK